MRSLFLVISFLPTAVLAQFPQLHVVHDFTFSEGRSIGLLSAGPDGNFYQTTLADTVFRITPEGTLMRLATFNGLNGRSPSIVGLVSDNRGNLFGTTDRGGVGDNGTIFKLTLDGNLSTLVKFSYNAFADGLVIAGDGTLYGTTILAQNGSDGTVFKLTPNGSFITIANVGSPAGGLVFGRDGQLYGRTYNGLSGVGFVYRVTTNGALTILAALAGCDAVYSTALTLGSDGNFYGTTITSGARGLGTAFKVTPDGKLTKLLDFDGNHGSLPSGPLTPGSDSNFYGTTIYGGVYEGTVYKLTTDGQITTLANFPSRSFGVRPYDGVIFGSNGSLYGTTSTGGRNDLGIFFRVDLPPEILVQPVSSTNDAGTTVIFTVGAMGTKPFSYQWLRNGTSIVDSGNVSGTISAALTLSNLNTADAGDYSVIITNVSGSVTSSVAVLTIVEIDTDADGVPDRLDACPGTPLGAIVDRHGCSIEQLAPCEGPAGGGKWKNHGEYLIAVAGTVRDFLSQGFIDEQQAKNIFSAAAHSDCGRR